MMPTWPEETAVDELKELAMMFKIGTSTMSRIRNSAK